MPRDPALREGSVGYTFTKAFVRDKALQKMTQAIPELADHPFLWPQIESRMKSSLKELEAWYLKVKEKQANLKPDDAAGKQEVDDDLQVIMGRFREMLRLATLKEINVNGFRHALKKPEDVERDTALAEADTTEALDKLDTAIAKKLREAF